MLRVRELDGLRAIAILFVLGCHYEGFVRISGGLSGFGWLGVDIFFALSGYLITTILLGLRNKKSPFTTFYSRRTIRIFPPYFACIFVILILGFITHNKRIFTPSFLFQQFFFLQAAGLRYVPFMVAWLRHPLHQIAALPNLLHNAHVLPSAPHGLEIAILSQSGIYWSLSIEEYFYLLWAPVVLWLPERAIVVLGCAICVIETLARWSWGGGVDGYTGIFFRFDALVYGAFLALLLKRWKHGSYPVQLGRTFIWLLRGSAFAIAIMLFALWPVVGREIRDSPLFLAFGLPAISIASSSVVGLLVVRAESNWWFCRLMRTAAMQFIGTISYTMYLVHILAALLIVKLVGWTGAGSSTPVLLVEAVASSILAIIIARLSWQYMEKPLLSWKDRRFPSVTAVEHGSGGPTQIQPTQCVAAQPGAIQEMQ